jgi:phosphoadenosine phosphosulfate reductase
LTAKGYVSIGDWHSSAPLTEGMRPEDTRFGGSRRECGLHLESSVDDYRI